MVAGVAGALLVSSLGSEDERPAPSVPLATAAPARTLLGPARWPVPSVPAPQPVPPPARVEIEAPAPAPAPSPESAVPEAPQESQASRDRPPSADEPSPTPREQRRGPSPQPQGQQQPQHLQQPQQQQQQPAAQLSPRPQGVNPRDCGRITTVAAARCFVDASGDTASGEYMLRNLVLAHTLLGERARGRALAQRYFQEFGSSPFATQMRLLGYSP